jgi:hypothetical protein
VVLFYIILWFEQVAGNIRVNSKVYCKINVRSCFVMVLNFIFLVPLRKAKRVEVWLMYGDWLLYRCRAT